MYLSGAIGVRKGCLVGKPERGYTGVLSCCIHDSVKLDEPGDRDKKSLLLTAATAMVCQNSRILLMPL